MVGSSMIIRPKQFNEVVMENHHYCMFIVWECKDRGKWNPTFMGWSPGKVIRINKVGTSCPKRREK